MIASDGSDRGWVDREQVLESNKIKVVTMDGGMTRQKCMEVVGEFRSSDRDGARVLLLSNVDLVGLDITCANILILVVRDRDRERGTSETTQGLHAGRAVVGCARAATHSADVETAAGKTSPHLSPGCDAICGHLPFLRFEPFLVSQPNVAREFHEHGA